MDRKIGFAALITTAVLWGSSFPAIKVTVNSVGGTNYVWIRSSVAILTLLPYMLYKKRTGRLDRDALVGGTVAGIVYALGLWLQGVGTGLTRASNAAFITGLNVVIVHSYAAFIARDYSLSLLSSMIFSITGLYVMTSPSGGPNTGDLLVLASAFLWASQVIIVSRYSHSDPLQFTFYEMIPSLSFALPLIIGVGRIEGMTLEITLILVYLGMVCSVLAFALQVYGQRVVSPSVAAVIYLVEPPAAALISHLTLDESFDAAKVFGSLLILIGMYMAVRSHRSEASR